MTGGRVREIDRGGEKVGGGGNMGGGGRERGGGEAPYV
jgi:hypothetical protein